MVSGKQPMGISSSSRMVLLNLGFIAVVVDFRNKDLFFEFLDNKILNSYLLQKVLYDKRAMCSSILNMGYITPDYELLMYLEAHYLKDQLVQTVQDVKDIIEY